VTVTGGTPTPALPAVAGGVGALAASAGVCRARLVAVRTRTARAFLDLGFGVGVRATLWLKPPGGGGGSVRAWCDGRSTVLVRPGRRTGRWVRARLVEGEEPPHVYRLRAASAVDGDTLDVRVELGLGVVLAARVRLLGVDAPERHTAEGRRAAEWVSAWLESRTGLVMATVKDRREKYGRFLATVWDPAGGCSLNGALLAEGLAAAYRP